MAAQSSIIDKHSEIMFDEGNSRPFLRVYKITSNGNGNGFSDFELDNTSPYTPIGQVLSISNISAARLQSLLNRNTVSDFNSVRLTTGAAFFDPRSNAPIEPLTATAPATINTNLISFDCGDCAQLYVRITGVFTGTITIQGDNNSDFAAPYSINAWNLNTNAITTTVTATNTNLIIPIRSSHFRLRFTTAGTGTATVVVGKVAHTTNANFTTVLNSSLPVTQSGTWNVGQTGTWNNSIAPSTAQGYSTGGSFISALSTNATLIKTGATTAGWLRFTNISATTCYLRFYSKSTAPIAGTDVTLNLVALLPNQSFDMDVAAGTRYPLGLGFAITRNFALLDNTPIGANEVIGTWMVV
jgi:hypothetical protein